MPRAQSNHNEIPACYRIFFTSIDPLIALSGAYMDYFDPETILASAFPRSGSYAKPTPPVTFLLMQAGGSFIMMAFLMVFMLRYTSDVKIWKMFQFGVLVTDFTLFFSLFGALEGTGRLNVGAVRWEEWGTIIITGFLTLLRLAFLGGFGFGKTGRNGEKKE
ncbi:hypothetical protein DPSP01_013309 [Paraphaeosphaeria sporulosa]|uniref:DUF7704 domain-containing protein n=1 Tax=Paraphaeosphaeria sporulosa TaxID=1460663 RepID=A0A177CT67_9PLEO|nr:uncharacterized protein CC84DRAFT_1161426 [Paraphaeosphaeria sporulosa]OAG10486.1 hypothetical protein CC84DRAFT_1161426 [Paraphaeosphaeria sporulosa]